MSFVKLLGLGMISVSIALFLVVFGAGGTSIDASGVSHISDTRSSPSGSVHGTVVFKSGDSAAMMPASASVAAYQGNALVGASLLDANGQFRLYGLTAGVYTLKVKPEEFIAADMIVTVTPGNDIDMGAITVNQHP